MIPGVGCALNPAASDRGWRGLFTPPEYDRVAAFFDRYGEAAATPLLNLSGLAAHLGIAELLVKDESRRLGLPAFKVLGVAYAVDRLIGSGTLSAGSVVVSATTGNHGRALAHVGRLRGLRVRIYVPLGTIAERRDALEQEGAEVVVVDGNYDGTVRRAADEADAHGWTIVSDTAWPGYEEIPRWIMAGYTRMLAEAARAWGARPPDVVLVQAGVGGLACAVASWWASRAGSARPFIIACEPVEAACLLASARAGRPTVVSGALPTAMTGLRAGQMSSLAWPAVERGIDAFVAIDDERAFGMMRRLARPASGDPAVVAGPAGACGLAALHAILTEPALAPLRQAAGLGASARVLAINTEGATDTALYDRVVTPCL